PPEPGHETPELRLERRLLNGSRYWINMLVCAGPAVSLLNGLVLIEVLSVLFQSLVDRFFDPLIQLRLVLLHGQNVVASAVANAVGDLPLTAHCVDCYQGPGDLQQLE